MAPTRPFDAGTRIQALSLLQVKTPIEDIIKRTGFTKSTIYRIQKIAKDRGYDPSKDTTLYLTYVEDAPRVGRPKKITLEVEEEVIKTISKNSTTHTLSTQQIKYKMLSPTIPTTNSVPKRTISFHQTFNGKRQKCWWRLLLSLG
jgi:transposase